MTTHEHWHELSSRLDALALKMKLHFEQAEHEEVAVALGTLGRALEDAFAAVGTAVRDDAIREDLRDVGRMLAEGIADTLDKAGREWQDVASHRTTTGTGG